MPRTRNQRLPRGHKAQPPVNSEWVRRSSGLITDRAQVHKAMNDDDEFETLVDKYEAAVKGYMVCILLRQKAATDATDAAAIASQVWEEMKRGLPEQLRAKWAPHVRFRDVLLEEIHQAHHRCLRPPLRSPFALEPDTAIFNEQVRNAILGQARKRLKESRGPLAATILDLWEADPDAPNKVLNARLAQAGTQLRDDHFRQALNRDTLNPFGRFLLEAAAPWIDREDAGPEAYYDLFEKAGLLGYAHRLTPCRWLLGLD